MIAYLLVGAFSGLYLFAFAFGSIAGMSDARIAQMEDRPKPRLDHDCDVYSDCRTMAEEGERLIGLYCVDRVLDAAALRVGAAR